MRLRGGIAAVALLLATAAPAFADFEAGVKAYDAGDYTTAYNEWLPLAAGGDPFAQRNLGHLYRLGLGVPQNFEVALNWYRRAAEQGLVRAEANLANMLLRGQGVDQDPREAATWFHRAAVAGHVISQFNIGQMYRKGLAVPQDNAKALGWFQLAADGGHERSIELVAIMSGEGVVAAPEEDLVAPPFGERQATAKRPPAAAPAPAAPRKPTDDTALLDDEDDDDDPFAKLLGDDDETAPAPTADRNAASPPAGDDEEDGPVLADEEEDLLSDDEDGDAQTTAADEDKDGAQVAALADEADAEEDRPQPIVGSESERTAAPLTRTDSLSDSGDDLIGGEEDSDDHETAATEETRPAETVAPPAQVAARAPEPLTRRPRLSDDAMAAAVAQGLGAYRDKDFTGAFRIWLPLAEAGNADAQSHIAGLYMDGAGVPVDHVRAWAWWRLAAEKGHSGAREFLDVLDKAKILDAEQLVAARALADDLRRQTR